MGDASQRLQQAMDRASVDDEILARRIRKTPSYVREILNGSKPMSEAFAAHAGLALGVEADWLLTGAGSMFPESAERAAAHSDDQSPRYSALPIRPPLRVTAYKCWRCRGPVERPAEVCPHCAARFHWPDWRTRKVDQSEVAG